MDSLNRDNWTYKTEYISILLSFGHELVGSENLCATQAPHEGPFSLGGGADFKAVLNKYVFLAPSKGSFTPGITAWLTQEMIWKWLLSVSGTGWLSQVKGQRYFGVLKFLLWVFNSTAVGRKRPQITRESEGGYMLIKLYLWTLHL